MLHIPAWKRVLIWATCALALIFATPNLFYDRVERHNDAVAALEQGARGAQLDADRAGWPSFLPSFLVNLGLDLRGGAHLLAEVRVSDAMPTASTVCGLRCATAWRRNAASWVPSGVSRPMIRAN